LLGTRADCHCRLPLAVSQNPAVARAVGPAIGRGSVHRHRRRLALAGSAGRNRGGRIAAFGFSPSGKRALLAPFGLTAAVSPARSARRLRGVGDPTRDGLCLHDWHLWRCVVAAVGRGRPRGCDPSSEMPSLAMSNSCERIYPNCDNANASTNTGLRRGCFFKICLEGRSRARSAGGCSRNKPGASPRFLLNPSRLVPAHKQMRS
jgi:hypothetical protein